MLACYALDIKEFMSHLFLKETFDHFYLAEAGIVTYNTFLIDGLLKEDYFTKEEWEEKRGQSYSKWETLRPYCFQLIKGKKTPLSLKIVFRLTEENVEKVLEQSGLSLQAEEVAGLFFNVRYENNKIICTTGTSLKTFTLDKSVEECWDSMMIKFLKHAQIAVTEA